MPLQADTLTTSTANDSLFAAFHTEFCPEQYAGFFRDNAFLHPELPYRNWGEEAVRLPYTLWRDDWVAATLLLCLLLLVYALNKTRKQLLKQTKNFFIQRSHNDLHSVKTGIEKSSHLIMVAQLCLLAALITFTYAEHHFDISLCQQPPRWLLGFYILAFLIFYLLKRMMIEFINWIFFPKSQQKEWKENYSFLISVESIVFFPLVLTLVYFQISFDKFVWIFLFILLIIKFLLTFKTFKIFFPKSYCLFHLFVYLCGLEIMPLLTLWKTLALLTEYWIVKY